MNHLKSSFKVKSIDAIAKKDVVEPNMPVEAAVQEAEDLFHTCQEDRDLLVKAGLDWAYVTDLPVRVDLLREAQSVWGRDYKSRLEAERVWKQKSPGAFGLRDELIHYSYHAYREFDDLVSVVRRADDGDSNAKMIQSLNDLAVLGESNLELLQKVSCDPEMLKLAREMADEMGNLLGMVNAHRYKSKEQKYHRDRAYTYLKLATDEIRCHGQFVFWRTPERKYKYTCFYNRKYRNGTSAPGEEAQSSDIVS